MKKLIRWRICTLQDRVFAIQTYIEYRRNMDKKLEGIKDWLVLGLLWIRRLVNATVLGFWLWCLRLRLALWRKAIRFYS